MPGKDQAGSQQEAVLPVIDSVHNYEKIHRIGEGTYGVVCECRHQHRSGCTLAAASVVRWPMQTRPGTSGQARLWR